jgi:hypothetical protein
MLGSTVIQNEPRYPVKNSFVFKGEQGNPLLAPRGVCLHNNLLAVSDTAQNRVMIWFDLTGEEHQPADIILGQTDGHHAERNNGGNVSAQSLLYPSGIWTNGKMLIVADAWNHRVLIWNSMPSVHGQPADVVLGQPNFQSNLPNVLGLSKPPDAKSLYWPYGVYSDGTNLWIADTGNRRVLFFEAIPLESNIAADRVIGQLSFSERDYDSANAVWPYSVKVSEDGQLSIADTQYYRVLLWKDWRDAFDQNAQVIVGQPDAASNGPNQYNLFPKANTLNWCYDSCFLDDKLVVADSGNSRILIWDRVPIENDEPANLLIGQSHFSVNGESSLSLKTNIENEMYWPFALSSFDDKLAVADTGNHRIIIYGM